MRFVHAFIDHVRNDFREARSVAGYIKRRLLEKGTWAAVAGSVVAANSLQPKYATLSIAIALIVALCPTP